ncbi:MAG TPA: hypothetical protein VI895_13070 [Bdellovibrionota bacterium]|nr:hypothetical protein [Bdellovibrionota bacterium]
MATSRELWITTASKSLLLLVVVFILSPVISYLSTTVFAKVVTGAPDPETFALYYDLTSLSISLAIGTLVAFAIWKGTSEPPWESTTTFRNIRLALRIVVLAHVGLVALSLISRPIPAVSQNPIVGWSTIISWWLLTILGWVYVQVLFKRIGRDKLAIYAGILIGVYVLANVLHMYIIPTFLRETSGELATPGQMMSTFKRYLIPFVPTILSGVLIIGLLWRLRKALLQRGAQQV